MVSHGYGQKWADPWYILQVLLTVPADGLDSGSLEKRPKSSIRMLKQQRLNKVTEQVQGPVTGKWGSPDDNSALADSKALALSPLPYHLFTGQGSEEEGSL